MAGRRPVRVIVRRVSVTQVKERVLEKGAPPVRNMAPLEAGKVPIKAAGEGRVGQRRPASQDHGAPMKGRLPPSHEGPRGETRATVGARVAGG